MESTTVMTELKKIQRKEMTDLFQKIDKLVLGPRLSAWKEMRKTSTWKICSDRDRICMASWKETEGEDIEIRRAKLFKKLCEEMPIDILDIDLIVGRVAKGLLEPVTASDIQGDYIPGLWEDEDELGFTTHVKGAWTKEDKEVLRDAARYFQPRSAQAHVCGAWRKLVGSWSEDMEQAKLKDPWMTSGFLPCTVTSPLWRKVLEKGLRAYIEEAREKLKWFMETNQTDIDKFYFWKAVIMVCEAGIAYARRYAALAREKAEKEKNPERKEELLEIAQICERVPENPARTFHEAVQSVHFVYTLKLFEHPSYSANIGRADQFLWPYFKKDFDSGNLTLERAAEILEYAIGHWGTHVFVANADFKDNHQVNYGLNIINIGGVDKDGNDASNPLSYLILHVAGLLKLSAPSIGFEWHKNSPRWLMNKAIETNIRVKGGCPIFENGDHVVERFAAMGEPLEDARDWYTEGCITPIILNRIDHYGAEGVGSFNVVGILDVTLHNGVSAITDKKVGLETGNPCDFNTFDELFDAFKKQLKFVVWRMFWMSAIARQENRRYIRFPFMSTIMADGCMENGEDLMIPNPAYHTFLITDRANIDAADSLIAIRKLVFEDKKLSMRELMDTLDSNFEGPRGEEIRKMCLAVPKFGNDDDEADQMAHDVAALSASIIQSYDNSPFPPFKISREGLSWHYFGGLGVGALPNGRKSMEPLNDGSLSPMRGMDTHGPTAVLRSALKADFKESTSSALNQKFPASIMKSPENREKLAILTETFLKQGGQHIQYNLVDTEELLEAKANPENHGDLIVRIGGFSAYFVELSSAIQDDVIHRSEQGL